MNDPVVDFDRITATSIFVIWEPILSNLATGAVPITSYSLEWDQGTSNWVSLIGVTTPSLQLYFNLTSGLTPG
jgi:hypothetical protein